MKVRILVLNYNGAALLKKYLPSLIEACRHSRHECVLGVVDNASVDSSREVVESLSVQWIPVAQNRVLCSYNEVAKNLSDDLLILINNDIEVEKDFVDPLVEPFVADKSVFFVTPRCLSLVDRSYEGNKTKGFIRYGVYWSTSMYPGHEKTIDRSGLTLQGGFGAFDRKKFVELGGYDDLYLPGRLEDADICFSAYKRGWKCLYEPKSVVYHEGGVSFKKEFGVKKTLVINWRNTFLFMWKNFSDFGIILRFIFWLPARLMYSILSGKSELFLGFLEFLPKWQLVMKKRRVQMERFEGCVSDRAILEAIE